MSWEIRDKKLIGANNEQYDLGTDEHWYVVPARTHYSPYDGQKVRPLEFAVVLHNASLAKGLLISPTAMARGFKSEPKSLKRGAAAEAEELLEVLRKEKFPERPSRLRCFFLNRDKDVAEYRMRDSLRGHKTLVRCFIVLNGAKIHHADGRLYEQLEGRPDDAALASKYWETFTPSNEEERRHLEVVADCALYFPDWKTFPTIPFESMKQWALEQEAAARTGDS